MFKNIICFVLMTAMLLLPACLAEPAAVTNFTFMDTITWASKPDEVEAVLGEGVQRVEETDESIGTVAMLWTENKSFAGYKSDKIAFTYYNNALCYIACYYTETDVSDTQLLIDELVKIYGVPEMQQQNGDSLTDFVMGTKTKCEWNIGDETNIKVVQVKNDDAFFPLTEHEPLYPYLCFVEFRNLPIAKQLEEEMNALAAAQEEKSEK